MPLYEYRCDACGNVFEVIQKFADEPLTTHAGCGGHVKRLLSTSALQFKGSGWYVTDYAHKNGTNGSSNGHKGETKSETASGTKSEAKSESKAGSNGSGSVSSKSENTSSQPSK